MGTVTDRAVDGAGGAVVGGAKGAAAGLLTTVAIGAAVVGGIGIAALAAAEVLTVGGALGALAIGGLVGALPVFSVPAMTIGAAIGGLVKGGKGLLGMNGKEKQMEPSVDQQLAAAKAYKADLDSKIMQRTEAATSFDNPNANQGFVAKTQQTTTTQQQSTTPADGDKSNFVSKTQTAKTETTYAPGV